MSTSACTIRHGTPADRDFVRDLGNRTVDSNLSSLRIASSTALIDSYDRLLSYVFSGEHILLIAWLGERAVGFVIMITHIPDEVTGLAQAFIAYAAVEEDVRRRGVGAALFLAAEKEARKCGLPHLSLMVTEDNEAALALYRKLGYSTERRLLCKVL